MRQYEEAKMEVITFETNDVITTSDTETEEMPAED